MRGLTGTRPKSLSRQPGREAAKTAANAFHNLKITYDGDDAYHRLTAHHGGEEIGSLTWHKYHPPRYVGEPDTPGLVSDIEVHPDYQRRGVGTALWEEAQKYDPSPVHSDHLVGDGPDWVKSLEAARWSPSSGVFGPTTGYDPVLFGDRHELRPEVRRDIMERLDQALRVDTGLVGSDWQDWTKVYIAGGSASEWAGGRPNDAAQDLDVLIGVNYFEARRGSGAFQGMDSSQIDTAFNTALRSAFNESGWQPEFGGTWDLTGYVNPDAYDITKIKPYAAYDVTDMEWAVKPPHLPEHSVADFDPAVIQIARAVAAEARAILRLPEPIRTREARALWERLHAERRMAFSDQGEGWQDVGNLVEKWLAYAPRKPLEKIRELALAPPKTAALTNGKPDLTSTDYEGRVGDPSHITRVERGWLPTSAVAHMPGAKGEVPGEHTNRRGQKWEDWKARLREEGIQNPLFITVDHGQEPRLSEGNHRRDFAVEEGLSHVPVEIRYYGHAEQQGLVHERQQHIAAVKGPFYHGTFSEFEPGHELTPEGANTHGRRSRDSRTTVSYTSEPWNAVNYASDEWRDPDDKSPGRVYEVKPLDEHGHRLTHHEREPDDLGDMYPEYNYRTPGRLRVVRELGHDELGANDWRRLRREAAPDHIVLYHGTSQENADAIARHGLQAPEGHWYPAQWPITTVNRQTADAYATRGDQHATVEIHVPRHQAGEYLWPAQDHIGGAAYAPKKDLPAAWVHAVHPVTEPVDFPDDRSRRTAAVEPFTDEGEVRPWTERWPGEPGEDAAARRERYVRQVADRHDVGTELARHAITKVAQDVRTGEPFTHVRGYGYATDPGSTNDRFFDERMIRRLNEPGTWRGRPVQQVSTDEIHPSQPWLNPSKLAHNLFHPGKDVPPMVESAGHPDIDPDEERHDFGGEDEISRQDLGGITRFVRRSDGRMQVADGHHRVAIDMLLGKETTPGTVIDEAELRGRVKRMPAPGNARDLHAHMLRHHDRTSSELPEPRDANHLDLVDEHHHSHEFDDPGHAHGAAKTAAADSIYVPPALPAEALEKAKTHPHQVAASYAQMAMWHDHPRVRMQFPQSHEGGDDLVGHMLSLTGYGGDTEGAFVARHPRPENGTSNAAWLNGKPGVALHPDRWEYGIVAHEAAHHAVMYHHAIGPNEPQTDEQVHGPEWSGAYAKGLNIISPHAGEDFLAHKQHYLDQIAAHHGMAKQAAFDSDVRDHGFRHVDESMSEIPDHVHLGRLPAYTFPLSKITVASQPKVDPALVRQYRDDPPKRKKIIVRPYGEHLAVADGHHAIAAARARGETHIRARWMGEDYEDPSDYTGEDSIEKEASGSDGDDWVTCEQGCEHWGKHGAAGLLIRHRDDDGLYRYLLQKRSDDGDEVDHPGVWSIPSGAIGEGETPEEGARREYREEHGPLPQGVTHHHTVKSTDHGNWAFHTVVMDAPERFSPRGGGETEDEQQGAAWHTAAEVRGMKNRGELHPAFAESWDQVRQSRPTVAQATETQATADYRQADSKTRRCGGCVMFRKGKKHDWCTKVKGAIEESGVCRFFYAKGGKTAASGYNLSPGSGMIYLDIPPELINHLPGGVDDHHITLVYLGKGLSDEQFEEACRRAAATASRHQPLEGVLRGIETFPPSESSDGKTPAFVPAYIPGIGKLRQELEDLSASQHKDYTPHVTLAYLEAGEPLPPPHPAVPLKFTHLHVKRGDDVQSFPLGEPLRVQADYRQPPTEETWQARRQRVERWLDRQGEMMSLPHKWGPHTSNQVAHTLISDYDGPTKDEHWEHLPTQDVSLRQPIHTHQGFVYTDTVKHYLKADDDPDAYESGEYTPGGDEPKLVRHNGTHYLLDGHHRYAKDRLMGHESMVGKVFDTSNPEHKQSNCYHCHESEAQEDYDHDSSTCPTCRHHGWTVW